MTKRWKPGCYVNEEWREFKTYRELKKKLPELIKEDEDYEGEGLFVLRSKRGKWGEWFERWKIVNNKPTIVRQGWS